MYQPPLTQDNTIKVTLFFRDPGTGLAWSEAYFPTALTSVDAAIIPAIQLMNAREKIDAWPIVNTAVRVSNESIQRDAELILPGPNTYDKGGQTEVFGSPAEPAEVPYSTVLIREQSGSLYHAQRYLSGIEDRAIVDPPGPDLANKFGANFLQWQQLLYGQGKGKLLGTTWGFIALSKSANDRIKTPVLNIGKVLNTYSITVQTMQFAVGDIVKVYGGKFTGNQSGSGYMLVIGIDADARIVTVQPAPGYTAVWAGGGTLQRLRRIVVPYSSYEIRGETHRKRGGRFFLPRGKSPNRK